jgi:hypothetical protein
VVAPLKFRKLIVSIRVYSRPFASIRGSNPISFAPHADGDKFVFAALRRDPTAVADLD